MSVDAALRAEVLARDNHQCVKCGSDGPRLATHHRVFVPHKRQYGGETVDDLETLCMSCHGKLHHQYLQDNPPEFRCPDCGRSRTSPCYLSLLKCECGKLMYKVRLDRAAKRAR